MRRNKGYYPRQTSKKKNNPHSNLLESIKDILALFKIWSFAVIGSALQVPGISDRLACVPGAPCPVCGNPATCKKCGSRLGIFTAIEAKTGEAQLSSDQRIFQDLVRKNGGIFIEARQEEDLAKALNLPIKFGG